MKKYILLAFLSSYIGLAEGNYFDDWSTEDLCRWIDAPLIPENISEEMYVRQVICDESSKVVELTVQSSNASEYSTSTPPKVSTPPKPKLQLRINYKITL